VYFCQAVAARLGALVIGSISDGMEPLAVTIDAVSRRGRASAGRA
jgi:hypothetical protein